VALRALCLALSLLVLIPGAGLAKPIKLGKSLIEYEVRSHYMVRGRTITINARTDRDTTLIRLVAVSKIRRGGATTTTESEEMVFTGGEMDDEGRYRLWKLEIPSPDEAGAYIYALYPGHGKQSNPTWGHDRAEFTIRTYEPLSIISGHAKPKEVELGDKTTIQFKTTSDVTFVNLISKKKKLVTFKLPDKKKDKDKKAKKPKETDPKITVRKRDGYILWTIVYPVKASFKPAKSFTLKAGSDKRDKLGKAFKLPMQFVSNTTPSPKPGPTYEVAAASARLSDMPVGLDVSINTTLALDADWQLAGNPGFLPDARLLEVARSLAADYAFVGQDALGRELARRLDAAGIKLLGNTLVRYERFSSEMTPGDIAMSMRRKYLALLESGKFSGAVVGVAEVVGGYDAFLLASCGVELTAKPAPTPLIR